MSAYLIVRAKVTDWQQYRKYMEKTPDLLAKYGGRFIVRGGVAVTLEGPEETARIVVIEFPSLAKAQEFYHSAEYVEAKALRKEAASAQFVAVEGVTPSK